MGKSSKFAAASQLSTNHLMWEGHALPCFVKVSVFEAGMAAGLGVKCTNPSLLKKFLAEPEKLTAFRGMLHTQIDVELDRQKVVYGIDKGAILNTVSNFVSGISEGTEVMAMSRVADGQRPLSGTDGRLEYVLNADGLAILDMGRGQRRQARSRIIRVHKGDVLVVRHPAKEGQEGQNVRGESIAPTKEGREAVLDRCLGSHTAVEDQKLVAALEGVVREDMRGQLRVVQELAVDEVNHATGDLPHSGVGDINVLVRKVIARGAGVQSTEDVFVGTASDLGVVEANSRVLARNLVVRGSVVGEQLPSSFLSGEVETLDAKAQKTVRVQVETGRIQVEGIFAAQEVRQRFVTAERILVQSNAFNSVLEAEDEVRVDGNVVGGAVCAAGGLQVGGDLGNEDQALTRLRVETEPPGLGKRKALAAELWQAKDLLAKRQDALGESEQSMVERAETNAYWADLMNGGNRPPKSPMERKFLQLYLEEVKAQKRLAEEVGDAQSQARDLGRLLAEEEEEAAAAGVMYIEVGGMVYPGVRLELLELLSREDLEQSVYFTTGEETTLRAVRARLLKALNHHLELYQTGVEERRASLDQIFKGQEQRPESPTIPNKCFDERVLFPELGEEYSRSGLVFAHAHAPKDFYLLQMVEIKVPLENAVFSVEKNGPLLGLKKEGSAARVGSWQQDTEVLEALGEPCVLGVSAREHLQV